MQPFLLNAHSGLRYLVLAVAGIALVWFLMAIVRGHPFGKGGRILFAVHTGLIDLQVLLGLGLLAVTPFYGALAGHITMMLLAVICAHGIGVINKRKPEAERSNGLAAVGVVVPLILIVGGIVSIGRPLV